jgi:hypothetical protein
MKAQGTFEVTAQPEPPYDAADGVNLGRMSLDKRWTGGIEGTSQAQMLSARTPMDGSAGYVAIERVIGTLAGKRGSFVLQHNGIMTRGAKTLSVTVVPDSATGELQGLSGQLAIENTQGQHHYVFEYEFV